MATALNGTNITAQQEAYINFRATGGYYWSDDEQWVRMSIDDFSKAYGIPRRTLFNWHKQIPHFWKIVAEHADNALLADVPNIYKAIKLKALKGDTVAAKFLLNQADHLKATLERHEHEITGFTGLVERSSIVQAEVIDDSGHNALPSPTTTD